MNGYTTGLQVGFAQGRKNRLDEELGLLGNDEMANKLKTEVFNKSDDSIRAVEEIAQDLDSKDLGQLVSLIGYSQDQDQKVGQAVKA